MCSKPENSLINLKQTSFFCKSWRIIHNGWTSGDQINIKTRLSQCISAEDCQVSVMSAVSRGSTGIVFGLNSDALITRC